MHTHSKIALLAGALLAVSSTFALAADKKVAFVPQIIGIPYFDAMKAGGEEAAAKFGVDFIYQGPVDTNPVDQMQIVQNLIDQGVNAVAVSVLDASSIAPVVEAARAKHIALFTSDSDAPKSGRALYVAQATDEDLGDAIIDEMVKRVGEDAKIGIVSGERRRLTSTPGSASQARAKRRNIRLKLLEPQFAGAPPSAPRRSRPTSDSQSRPQGPDRRRLTTCPGVGRAIGTAGKIGKVIRDGYCSPNTARLPLEGGSFGCSVLWDPGGLGYLTVWAGKRLIDAKEIRDHDAGRHEPPSHL
jgi:rhamnose transport system substrate-binding protein